MTRLFSSLLFQVCLLAATMSLFSCGQRDMVLPEEHCTGVTPATHTNDKSTSAKLSAAEIIDAQILSNDNNAANGMRKTGGPDRKYGKGGGPIIVIEDTHFKAGGAK